MALMDQGPDLEPAHQVVANRPATLEEVMGPVLELDLATDADPIVMSDPEAQLEDYYLPIFDYPLPMELFCAPATIQVAEADAAEAPVVFDARTFLANADCVDESIEQMVPVEETIFVQDEPCPDEAVVVELASVESVQVDAGPIQQDSPVDTALMVETPAAVPAQVVEEPAVVVDSSELTESTIDAEQPATFSELILVETPIAPEEPAMIDEPVDVEVPVVAEIPVPMELPVPVEAPVQEQVAEAPEMEAAEPVQLALGDQPVGSSTAAPAAAPESDELIKSVDVHTKNAKLITVSKNTSAVIDLHSPADRAEVADPNIADIVVATPTRVIVTGKNYGLTQLMLTVGDRQQVFNVSVELDLAVLESAIRTISPTANVHARSVNGQIVLVGTVPDATTSERVGQLASLFQGGQVINQLSVAGVQQTMLRVVVAEVNKDAVRQLGFNWAIGASDFSRDFFFANNVAQLNPTTFGSSGLPDVRTGQLLYGVTPVANGVNTNITFGFPRAEFQVFMNALRQNSLARVLAEPNLVAISGQTATFLAGGEVPIPVTQGGATAGSITIEYKEFGVRLGFTPTVFGGQIIRLHIMSEVSEAIPGGAIAGGLPVFSFTTRRVESTIECGNGQTFAIAGLLNERVQSVAEKIPGLGDLPVLGALFSSVDYRKNNTELVVLVTPQLVEPLDPQQVPPPPGALMGHPNDFELFGLGQLEGTPRQMPELNGVPREVAPVNTPPSRKEKEESMQVSLQGPWGFAEVGEN